MYSDIPITKETLEKLHQLGVRHINNGGQPLTEEDGLSAISAVEEINKKRKRILKL